MGDYLWQKFKNKGLQYLLQLVKTHKNNLCTVLKKAYCVCVEGGGDGGRVLKLLTFLTERLKTQITMLETNKNNFTLFLLGAIFQFDPSVEIELTVRDFYSKSLKFCLTHGPIYYISTVVI